MEIRQKFIPPFLLGFMALSFQVILLREFSAHFYGNELCFGLVLASWLLWGGLGSISAGRIRFSSRAMAAAYYLVVLILPISLAGLRFSRFILKIMPGEITGLLPVLLFSLFLSLLISFPLGVLFAWNVHHSEGRISQVYWLESIGSAAAGLFIHFLLIPLLSNWETAATIGIGTAIVTFFTFGRQRQIQLFALSTLICLAAIWADFPTQKLFWQPFSLVHTHDSPYGKLQVLQSEEQITLYSNSLLVYSFPDLYSSEEAVHFAMIQRPEAANVLLIGGGVGGNLRQILQYPNAEVDYVELDPAILQISRKYLPEEELKILESPRVRILHQDGRSTLQKTHKFYDVVILDLPEPSTAQINRFYTKEFFQIVKTRLSHGGLLSFRVPSAENYISPELQNFLSSLFYTLKEEFKEVTVIPGHSNIFLASNFLFPVDQQSLSRRLLETGIQTVTLSPPLLSSRLSPDRVLYLEEKITSGNRIINRDMRPISYFTHSVLWSSQFHGLEARILTSLSRTDPFWLMDLPLILLVTALLGLGFARNTKVFHLVPLAVLGLTSIVAEITIIIAFQATFGFLYQRIALLFAVFMLGLTAGSFLNRKYQKNYNDLILIQASFVFFLILLIFSLQSQLPEFTFFLFLFIMGFLGGHLFVTANHLFIEKKTDYGMGYGIDLIGSFSGALIVSSILIPLVGLITVLRYLFLLNSFCLLFIIWGRKRNTNLNYS